MNRSPLSGIVGIVVVLAVLYVLFRVVGAVVSLLYWAAPLLLIASLIIDKNVFLGLVKSIRRLWERNWPLGLGATVLALVLYPFTALYLFGMALFKRKVRKVQEEVDERRNGRWTDYEELPEEPLDLDTTYEELPPPPPPRREETTDYDDLLK